MTQEAPAEAASPRRGRHRRSRGARYWVSVVLGVVLIAGGLALSGHIAWFYLRSSTKGAALTKQFHHEAAKIRATHGACPPLSDATPGAQGLVQASSIGLSAPVEAGDGDSVLNVAVGHVTGSVWPGNPGTVLLAAHDVSYFSQIDQLRDGQTIDFVTPCTTFVYVVTRHQVVPTGYPLYTTPSESRLVLETCYPLNALFITPKRYLVTSELKSEVAAFATVPAVAAPPAAPTVPAPPALAAQGLTLDDNDVQLGVLDVAGAPEISWEESPVPLNDEAAALADYFAGLRSSEQGEGAWWTQLAPAVPFSDSQPLHGARMSYSTALTPTVVALGTVLAGAYIDAGVYVSGGSEPGYYHLHVQETVIGGAFVITQWSMTEQR